MLIKAIALSLALIFGIGVIIPLTTNDAEAGARKHRKYQKRYKKYSKGWWRQYHRRARRKQEARERWRRERLRQMRAAKAVNSGQTGAGNQPESISLKTVADNAAAVLPTGDPAPRNWKKAQNTPSEMQFRVDDDKGSQVGAAAITVVGPAAGGDNETARVKTLGGIPTTSLRRTVIDRMLRENGWVVNDYQKELDGKKVYVVVAQSQGAGGRVQSRMFYFTESDGRIYSVATVAPADAAEKLAEETERVVNSLQKRSQQAVLK